MKFWDLETFELIGSGRPEVSVVICIHCLFSGSVLFCSILSWLSDLFLKLKVITDILGVICVVYMYVYCMCLCIYHFCNK